jgi:hypothetical protein
MPVSLNFRAISAGLLCLFVAACQPPTKQDALDVSFDELSEQLGSIEVEAVPFDELAGNTRAEKLLYQVGVVNQTKTAMLVMFDTQIKTMRMAGNEEMADQLSENRSLLMAALDEEMPSMIAEAGRLYEKYLTPEEIERLIVLHTDPAMQKMIVSQPKLSRDMLPVGEAFGLRAGARYEKALREQAAE